MSHAYPTILTVKLIIGLLGLGIYGCSTASPSSHATHLHEEAHSAVAVIRPTDGNSARGTLEFKQSEDGVTIAGQISGLTANQRHAIHIHEFGDIGSTDGSSAGGHYNPEGHPHALPDTEHRHAGDLGNVEADESGIARIRLTTQLFSIVGPHNPVLGRSVVIHADADDGGQPVGNAGGRIGIGVIGIAKP